MLHTTIKWSRCLRVTRFSASETNIVHLLLSRQTRARAVVSVLFVFFFIYYRWYYYFIIFYFYYFSRSPRPGIPSVRRLVLQHTWLVTEMAHCVYLLGTTTILPALSSHVRPSRLFRFFHLSKSRVVTFSVVVLSCVRYALWRTAARCREKKKIS